MSRAWTERVEGIGSRAGFDSLLVYPYTQTKGSLKKMSSAI
jgi:hypothetical protein